MIGLGLGIVEATVIIFFGFIVFLSFISLEIICFRIGKAILELRELNAKIETLIEKSS